jgi:beta-aspartyl-peptidase (threonine type)
MDAMIAHSDGRVGAVSAIQNIMNPISVARLVMEKTKNVLLVGPGANLFAKQQNIPTCKPEDLLTSQERERYIQIQSNRNFDPKAAFQTKNLDSNLPMDTVGCICFDQSGTMSVGLSTGGIPFKRSGRVGDTPLWGAGGYLDIDFAGVAATAYGEDIIKTLLSREVINYMKYEKNDCQSATEKAIHYLNTKGGLGGLISLSKEGKIGISFNTPRMAFGFNISGTMDGITVGIEHQDLNKYINKKEE